MKEALLTLMLSCSAADVTTTEMSLARGATELNPLMQNRGARITLNVAVPLGIFFGLKDEPKKFKTAAIVYSAFNCGAAAWNIKEMRKR